MKKLLIIFVFILTCIPIFAQKSERIAGIWWNDKKTSKLEIKKETNGSYSATIVYMVPEKYEDGKPPKDDKNPDPDLQNRSILGLTIINGLRYDAGKKEWNRGHFYDPESGKTYNCYVWMEDRNDMLFVKGSAAGIKWLGKYTEWTRTTL